MIKRKLKIVGAFLAIAGAFCLASCGSNSSAVNQPVVNSTDNINDKAEERQKYVIELNMDNYVLDNLNTMVMGRRSDFWIIFKSVMEK